MAAFTVRPGDTFVPASSGIEILRHRSCPRGALSLGNLAHLALRRFVARLDALHERLVTLDLLAQRAWLCATNPVTCGRACYATCARGTTISTASNGTEMLPSSERSMSPSSSRRVVSV